MADIQPTVDNSHAREKDGVIFYVWSNLNQGDKGIPVKAPLRSDKVVQVYGTFGSGGSLVPMGSCEPGVAVNFSKLKGQMGLSLSFNASSEVLVEQVIPNVAWFYPDVVGGDGTTDLTVILMVR